jgi:hypothetical protein
MLVTIHALPFVLSGSRTMRERGRWLVGLANREETDVLVSIYTCWYVVGD